MIFSSLFNKRLVLFIVGTLFSTTLLAAPDKQNRSKSVTLKLPSSSMKMQYTKELFTKAYASIGYDINWLDVASVQELALVNKAKLTGALARHPVIEKEFPTLIRIPYPLFDFKLLKVSDRRRCGYCLDEDIQSIIYAKGIRISANYVKSLRSTIDKLAINDARKLNQMILKRRVDSALIIESKLDKSIIENPHIIVETLAHEFSYHYLSPRYKHLKKPLIEAFKKLEQNGTVASLQEKYKVTISKMQTQSPEKISFISGFWLGYTNADGTGVYWDIIDNLFDADFSISKNTSIWARAKRAFEQNQADVLVGAYRHEKISGAIYSSFHIDYEYPLYAFIRNEEVLTRFKAKDTRLTACLNSGSSLITHVDFLPKENIVETSLEQCNLLIKKGKVDVIVEYDYNLDEYTQALPKVILLENSPLFLVFHDTPEGHFLQHYFDEKIATLARDNILKGLFPDNITYQQAHIRP